jgi:rubrerythrin
MRSAGPGDERFSGNKRVHGLSNPEVKMTDAMTPRQAIEFAVKTEELGTKFYQQLALKFSDQPELKELFELLAKDEVMHEAQFRRLLEKTPPDEGVSTGPEFQYLRAMSLSQFFMGQEGLKKKCREIEDKDDALGIAFELEKATLQFYSAMREVLGGNDTLDSVIEAERAHLTKVMQYIITDSKFRGLADKW